MNAHCVNCGKPRTSDALCPRCGGQWEKLSALSAVVQGLIENAVKPKVNGEGVVRRDGQIVRQQENSA